MNSYLDFFRVKKCLFYWLLDSDVIGLIYDLLNGCFDEVFWKRFIKEREVFVFLSVFLYDFDIKVVVVVMGVIRIIGVKRILGYLYD